MGADGMDRDRGGSRLRGWGGVAAMAGACALTASLTLVPLSRAGGAGSAPPQGAGTGVGRAVQAADDDCTPETAVRSLKPSDADGPAIRAIKTRAELRNKLVVGIDQNSYRWGYRNADTGELEGFDIDLARRLAAEIVGSPDDVVFRAVPTNQRIPMIKSGKVDMVVRTMTISCSRIAQGVAFSTAYFKAGQQLLAPAGTTITGYDETLQGKKVCSAAGSTALEELKKEAHGADISTTVPNQLDCLVRLQLGEVDAVVTDNALAAGQAAQDPMVDLVGATFTDEYYGVAMDDRSPDLVRRVNKVLDDYRADGWQDAYDKWLKAGLEGEDGKLATESSTPPVPLYRD
ncbi:glutamate ABC transporter substrate-binding protein [Streptomyces sp. NPDC060194]|uniref:glutamate ABC transporter substrate-binding protein n=1 Tax=Streptomyces sp. NPDC060194 TaxID=3347069 RepID=UPI00364A32BC